MIATIGFFLMMLALVLQVVRLLKGGEEKPARKSGLSEAAAFGILASSLLLLAEIVIRSAAIRFVAVTNIYESLLVFSALVGFLLFGYRRAAREKANDFIVFGGIVACIALLAIASSPEVPKEVLPPVPALQSHWLVLHVTFTFAGEAFFAVAFVAALALLFARGEEKRRDLDRLTYTLVGIGYPIYTLGALVFGAIWASYAWGSYWSWDPKETWALITWLTYTAYLHARLVLKMKAKAASILVAAGFIFALFTFFGVNYLVSGLHSYR